MAVNNIKLSTRIYFQQIMVVLALIGLGIYSLNNLQIIDDHTIALEQNNVPMLLQCIELENASGSEAQGLMALGYSALNLTLVDEVGKNEAKEEYEVAKNLFKEENEATEIEFDKFEKLNKELLAKTTDSSVIAVLKEEAELADKLKIENHNLDQLAIQLEKDAEQGNVEGVHKDMNKLKELEAVMAIDTAKLNTLCEGDVGKSVEKLEVTATHMVNVLYIVIISVSLAAILLTIITGFSLNGLRKSVDIISNSVQQVATAAAQSGNAISMVSDGSKRQSDSIGQAVTAVEQSVSVLAEVSKSAEEATELAKNAGTVVRAGKDKMDNMVRVVNRIQENSNKVNKITEIIAGIASQTNMLALNAAIEAARAGEQGKGFAVVADQVKSLAESSKSSVDDIVTLIEQAKIDASEAVNVASSVSAEMEKILESSKTTERMMQNISTAMEEQVSTTEELSQNMDALRDIGTSNANAAEEITETIIELSRIASDTNTEIKKFNI